MLYSPSSHHHSNLQPSKSQIHRPSLQCKLWQPLDRQAGRERRPKSLLGHVTSSQACDADRSINQWTIGLADGWNAVKSLPKVTSLATEVFYDNDGFQPVVNFSKLIYGAELLLRLGWRLTVPGISSCFAIAHALDHGNDEDLAGMLEMSIQTDIPAELSASSTKAAVVTTMAVLPKLQRQGIGSALLLAAQDWALTQDTALMALFVYRDNYAAIRLYERCGFVRAVKWVDPAWLACAEKGVMGPTRRVLYIKCLPSTES